MAHDSGERTALDADERTVHEAVERTAHDAGDRAIPDASAPSSILRRSGRFDAYMSRGPDLPSMTAIVATPHTGRWGCR